MVKFEVIDYFLEKDIEITDDSCEYLVSVNTNAVYLSVLLKNVDDMDKNFIKVRLAEVNDEFESDDASITHYKNILKLSEIGEIITVEIDDDFKKMQIDRYRDRNFNIIKTVKLPISIIKIIRKKLMGRSTIYVED